MPVAMLLESPCASSPAADLTNQNDFLWTQGAREEELLAHRSIYKNTVNTSPKPREDCKVGPEDWFVQNFELDKDSIMEPSLIEPINVKCYPRSFVNYQIHPTAVKMLHHPTKVTRTISIMVLLLIERLLMPTNAINYGRPIHQPRRIDLPVQKVKVKCPNKRK